jgi:hypothetical protein
MRGNATGALVPALVVLALVAVVAVAATGSTPTGTDADRPPSATFLDTLLSLGMLLVVPGAALLIYGLSQRKAIARELASGRYRRMSAAAFVAGMLIFSAVTWYRLRDWERTPIDDALQDVVRGGGTPPTTSSPDDATTTYEPRFAWIPVLVVLGLAGLGAVAWLVASRRRPVLAQDQDAALDAANVLDETLDDLRAESDPRRAVIAAYARLERTLAVHGFARSPAETQEEHVSRCLPRLAVDRTSVRRLAGLFARAKFSAHAVDSGMKEEAIETLVRIRDELREAAETQPDNQQPVVLRTQEEGG